MLPAELVLTILAGGGGLLVLVDRLLPLLVFVLLLVFDGCALDDWVDDDERPVWLDLNKILCIQKGIFLKCILKITSLFQVMMTILQFGQLLQITALIVVETYYLISFVNRHLGT